MFEVAVPGSTSKLLSPRKTEICLKPVCLFTLFALFCADFYLIASCLVNHCLCQEKGNFPLHVAAKEGQIFQAELLSVYGADPGALDSSGKTPIDHARYVF